MRTAAEKILIVEDDEQNSRMLREYLESHGYLCVQAYSGSEGKLRFSMEAYDLILLDLMLPGIAGEELVTLFSEKAPVIVLSAKSELDSKVEMLSAGADDYLCKPFDLPELLVRMQVQLRRRNRDGGKMRQAFTGEEQPSQPGQLSVPKPEQQLVPEQGDANGKTYVYRAWTLNPDTQEMTAEGEPVVLTRHEFLILELLIRHPKRVFTKQMIYEYAWGETYLAEDKTIHVHISNIRAKLKKSGTDSYIQTVWGMGFKLA